MILLWLGKLGAAYLKPLYRFDIMLTVVPFRIMEDTLKFESENNVGENKDPLFCQQFKICYILKMFEVTCMFFDFFPLINIQPLRSVQTDLWWFGLSLWLIFCHLIPI